MPAAAPAFTLIAIASLAFAPPAWAQATTQGSQSPAIVAGHDATVTYNNTYGLTPEQVQQLTKVAVAGVTGPLGAQLAEVSGKLGVTQAAALTLLRVLGEQDVPLVPRIGEARHMF
jgi:hypothetical protein